MKGFSIFQSIMSVIMALLLTLLILVVSQKQEARYVDNLRYEQGVMQVQCNCCCQTPTCDSDEAQNSLLLESPTPTQTVITIFSTPTKSVVSLTPTSTRFSSPTPQATRIIPTNTPVPTTVVNTPVPPTTIPATQVPNTQVPPIATEKPKCNKGGGNKSEGCDPGNNPDTGNDDETSIFYRTRVVRY